MYYCCVLMKSCRKTMSWHSRRFSQKNSALEKAFSAFVKCGRRQDGPVLDTALRPGPDGDIFYMEKSGGTKNPPQRTERRGGANRFKDWEKNRLRSGPHEGPGAQRKVQHKGTHNQGQRKTHCPEKERLSRHKTGGRYSCSKRSNIPPTSSWLRLKTARTAVNSRAGTKVKEIAKTEDPR